MDPNQHARVAPGENIEVAAPPPAYEPNEKSNGGAGPTPMVMNREQSDISPAAPAPAHTNYDKNINPYPVQQGMVTPLNQLMDQPAQVDCPYCHRLTMTRVVENDSSMTIISGVALGCLCLCLACLPCILHWFQDVDHYCSNCNKQLTHRPNDKQTQVLHPSGQPLVPSQYHGSGQGYEMQQQGQMQYQQQSHGPNK